MHLLLLNVFFFFSVIYLSTFLLIVYCWFSLWCNSWLTHYYSFLIKGSPFLITINIIWLSFKSIGFKKTFRNIDIQNGIFLFHYFRIIWFMNNKFELSWSSLWLRFIYSPIQRRNFMINLFRIIKKLFNIFFSIF